MNIKDSLNFYNTFKRYRGYSLENDIKDRLDKSLVWYDSELLKARDRLIYRKAITIAKELNK